MGCTGSSSQAGPGYPAQVQCKTCGLEQRPPSEAGSGVFACERCRSAFAPPQGAAKGGCFRAQGAVVKAPEPTAWVCSRPAVGSNVRLTPCCLYFDPQCMQQGPLKDTTQEGVLIENHDQSEPDDRPLVVQVQGHAKHRYRLGCVEDCETLRLHDMLFAKFAEGPASVAPSAGGKQAPSVSDAAVVRFPQFSAYALACTGEKVSIDIYEVICQTLGVHPTQGLTSGDFRRMYCEFSGDLPEDVRIAFKESGTLPAESMPTKGASATVAMLSQ
mmetsp:Transcript_25543/g.56027  ORF Transcript_25543/g.56027 Transcript_25543/m.56027 type:complete len:272 (-) Transcript_25543:118-933(-)